MRFQWSSGWNLNIFFFFRIANKINDFTSPYVFAIGLVTFAMLSISAITVLLQSGDGWFNAIAQSIAFPVYVALICGTWAFMGDFFSDSVKYLGSMRTEAGSELY